MSGNLSMQSCKPVGGATSPSQVHVSAAVRYVQPIGVRGQNVALHPDPRTTPGGKSVHGTEVWRRMVGWRLRRESSG
jgi:hypothetical protein